MGCVAHASQIGVGSGSCERTKWLSLLENPRSAKAVCGFSFIHTFHFLGVAALSNATRPRRIWMLDILELFCAKIPFSPIYAGQGAFFSFFWVCEGDAFNAIVSYSQAIEFIWSGVVVFDTSAQTTYSLSNSKLVQWPA